MKKRFLLNLIALLSAVVALTITTPPELRADSDIGCMRNWEEVDFYFNDVWHGGADQKPEYGCDVDPDDECDWAESGGYKGYYDGYHSQWMEGSKEDHNPPGHDERSGGNCGNS